MRDKGEEKEAVLETGGGGGWNSTSVEFRRGKGQFRCNPHKSQGRGVLDAGEVD